jgi:hypothetical protein
LKYSKKSSVKGTPPEKHVFQEAFLLLMTLLLTQEVQR